MKKSDFILIGVVVLIIGFALITSKGNEKLEDVNYPLTLTGEVGLHKISYTQYETMLNDGDAFILVIERTGCGWCTQYMPIVEDVAKEKKIPIYYIDIAELSSDEANKFNTSNNYLKKNQWGTPTTLMMLGSRVLDSIGSYVEKENVLSFLDGKIVMGE